MKKREKDYVIRSPPKYASRICFASGDDKMRERGKKKKDFVIRSPPRTCGDDKMRERGKKKKDFVIRSPACCRQTAKSFAGMTR